MAGVASQHVHGSDPMFTRQERFSGLALRAAGAMSIAVVLTVLNGCIVQERAYTPPPGDYPPPAREYTPPPANEYPAPPQEYPPSSQEYPPASQAYPQRAPSSDYGHAHAEIRTKEAP